MLKQAVLLCGGLGSRLGSLTRHTPKPLLKVNGLPFVEYLIRDLLLSGVDEVVLSVGYLKDKFNYLVDKYYRVRLELSEATIKESISRIKELRKKFLVINGDCYPLIDWISILRTDYENSVCFYKDSPTYKDVGTCILESQLVSLVDCGNMKDFLTDGRFEKQHCKGNLHIGSTEGLAKAEQYFSSR